MSCLNLLLSRIWDRKSIMIILGSGGHTGEMLLMLNKLDLKKFKQIYFVHAHNDTNSSIKAKEKLNLSDKENLPPVYFMKVYRSRNVGQSFKSSIFTTFISLIHSLYIIFICRPNLVRVLEIILLIL